MGGEDQAVVIFRKIDDVALFQHLVPVAYRTRPFHGVEIFDLIAFPVPIDGMDIVILAPARIRIGGRIGEPHPAVRIVKGAGHDGEELLVVNFRDGLLWNVAVSVKLYLPNAIVSEIIHLVQLPIAVSGGVSFSHALIAAGAVG